MSIEEYKRQMSEIQKAVSKAVTLLNAESRIEEAGPNVLRFVLKGKCKANCPPGADCCADIIASLRPSFELLKQGMLSELQKFGVDPAMAMMITKRIVDAQVKQLGPNEAEIVIELELLESSAVRRTVELWRCMQEKSAEYCISMVLE